MFFLITSKLSAILPTIRSRTALIRAAKISFSDFSEVLARLLAWWEGEGLSFEQVPSDANDEALALLDRRAALIAAHPDLYRISDGDVRMALVIFKLGLLEFVRNFQSLLSGYGGESRFKESLRRDRALQLVEQLAAYLGKESFSLVKRILIHLMASYVKDQAVTAYSYRSKGGKRSLEGLIDSFERARQLLEGVEAGRLDGRYALYVSLSDFLNSLL